MSRKQIDWTNKKNLNFNWFSMSMPYTCSLDGRIQLCKIQSIKSVIKIQFWCEIFSEECTFNGHSSAVLRSTVRWHLNICKCSANAHSLIMILTAYISNRPFCCCHMFMLHFWLITSVHEHDPLHVCNHYYAYSWKKNCSFVWAFICGCGFVFGWKWIKVKI